MMARIRQSLEESGLFEKHTPHRSGVERFQLKDLETGIPPLLHGASIYVQPNDLEFRIRIGALENERFWLCNGKLYDFVRSNNRAIIGSTENPWSTYVMGAEHVHGVIRLVRQAHGL